MIIVGKISQTIVLTLHLGSTQFLKLYFSFLEKHMRDKFLDLKVLIFLLVPYKTVHSSQRKTVVFHKI